MNQGCPGGFIRQRSARGLITHGDNSNLSTPCLRAFDGSKVICGVSRWYLYGFVKGDHAKWARS